MKLFLTASTITPNLIEPFEKFIGRSSIGLKAAFIPDASFVCEGDTSWVDEDFHYLIKGLKWQADRIILGNETPKSLQKLFDYDVIWVNGGYCGFLMKVMEKSGFDKLLPKLLAKGIIYVGSSAGSMVLSKVQDAASIYIGEPEPEALEIGGLGLVDFEFYPMHDERWTEDLPDKIKAKRNKNLKYYLVRDGQAVSVDDQGIKTHGTVIVLNN